MPKSRKLLKPGEVDVYCRKCQKTLPKASFYSALDDFLDSNGYMSVCKDCCNSAFLSILNVELDVRKAIFKICKILNMAYIPEAVESTIIQLDGKGDGKELKLDNAIGVYKSKIANYFRMYPDATKIFEPLAEVRFNEEDAEAIRAMEGEEFAKYLKTTWGAGLSIDDYNFLENSLSEWKRTHKCDTNSELVLMQEICHLQLKVRKDREQGLDTKTLVKSLQELIKTANLSPAQASMSSASKGNEVFGVWIKDFEQLEPAEWWDNHRELFIDVDNIATYFEDFVTRPIKNFITRSKDFVIKSMGNGVNAPIDIELKDSEEEME